jgi:predicted CDP-diglyceride synthetase/phosphatidate cytidylyltransferase
VGARCKNCARVTTIPTFEVKPSYYLRGVLAGGLTAIVTGLVVLILLTTFSSLPFLASILAIGAGYLVGEAISTAVNRKRGTGLAVVAGGCMVLFSVASGLIFFLGSFFGLLTLGFAFYSAIKRVR